MDYCVAADSDVTFTSPCGIVIMPSLVPDWLTQLIRARSWPQWMSPDSRLYVLKTKPIILDWPTVVVTTRLQQIAMSVCVSSINTCVITKFSDNYFHINWHYARYAICFISCCFSFAYLMFVPLLHLQCEGRGSARRVVLGTDPHPWPMSMTSVFSAIPVSCIGEWGIAVESPYTVHCKSTFKGLYVCTRCLQSSMRSTKELQFLADFAGVPRSPTEALSLDPL